MSNETTSDPKKDKVDSFELLMNYVKKNGLNKSQFESLFKNDEGQMAKFTQREAILICYIQFLELKRKNLEESLEELAVFGTKEISKIAQKALEQLAEPRAVNKE